MFSVFVQNGKGETREVQCLHTACGIGRDSDNLVVLQGWRIGKRHAWIRVRSDGLYLEPEQGRDPVRLNGTAIKGPQGPIGSSDVIEISDYQLWAISDRSSGPGSFDKNTVARDDHVTDRGNSERPPSETLQPVPVHEVVVDDTVDLRRAIHAEVVQMMDLRRLDVHRLSDEELRARTTELISEVLKKGSFDIPQGVDRELLIRRVLSEAIGLGPLEPLLEDESVTEIMVNAHDEIFIERAGRITRSSVHFTNDRAVLSAIERIVAPLGRRIDESSPLVDARLRDGSRVNAVIPPIALRGPSVSIRKFAREKLTSHDLLRFGSVDESMVAFLEIAVRERLNVIVSGGTGSGKTTLLNVLSNFIPEDERVVTIEDAAELRLVQPNLVSLEARPPNAEGKGQIAIRDLVKNALRMRPDRIVVGECRGGEALDMLQAMNTGHEGSLTTAHANSPREAVSRLEVMVLMAGMDLPTSVVREQIASSIDLIVHQRRFPCGSRKVSQITELTGIESGTIQLQDIFRFDVTSHRGEDGYVKGEFVATGAVPEFFEELATRGVPIDLNIFRNNRPIE